MVISGFGIKLDKSKRLWYIVIGAVTVAVFLIATSFIIVHKASNGKKNIGKIDNISGLFNIDSYFCEYNIKQISNKNQNSYCMKEWYLKDECENFKFEYSNEQKDIIEYIITNNLIKIKSSSQINEFSSDNYTINKKNIMSISTFIDIYNKLIDIATNEKNAACKIETITEDNKLHINIIFDRESKSSNEKVNQIYNEYKEFIENGIYISKLELVINLKTNLPEEYYIYDKEGNVYIAIDYTNFIINKEIDKKLFAFSDKWCIIYESRG